MSDSIKLFISRWETSGAAERANYQLFLSELCDLLGVARPDPATPNTAQNGYVFERAVTFNHGDGTTSNGRIDLYKRGCFVLEAKQGSESDAGIAPLSQTLQDQKKNQSKGIGRRGSPAWDNAMVRARGQGEGYIRALPAEEGRPPFLLVVDVGHSIELFSEFSCSGGNYIPYPAPGSHRIFLTDLAREDIRERLRAVWEDPFTLDPSRRSARVTREIAGRLAKLAISLEKAGHDPNDVAHFLMRCLFTMFAEDIGLLPKDGFTHLIESLQETPENFVPMVEELWGCMNQGGFSTSLRGKVLQFDGGLFAEHAAISLTRDQLLLLIEAAKCDWSDVEPAIFGTLLERALDPIERHKLGAHYTPRAYVERLVMPTIVNPVRAEWDAVRTAATVLVNNGDTKKAIAELQKFHSKLINIRVLDPACGTGNFLYVTLEHLKRIEGEIFDTLDSLGYTQVVMEMSSGTVDPHQLLGLEINPRAAAIAELVLWIGTLQWHFRNRGNVSPPQPIIRNFHNIECRDALIEWDAVEPLLDEDGNPVTHWDGRTTKTHPVTGKEVPDEATQVPVMKYINPQPAPWPKADYVVGNPPFIGPALMRQALGDGYTEAVRSVHSDVSSSSDFVMYWWNHAASLTALGKIQRFGFVSTNSIRQTFNRRTLERHMDGKNPISLQFAIPDHPWVDSSDGAAVRIAMTCGSAGESEGVLQTVKGEKPSDGDGYEVTLSEQHGKILADLTIGANVAAAVTLMANDGLSCPGVKLHGSGFIITPQEAQMLGLGEISGLENHIRGYRNGRDLTATPRNVMVIDLAGLAADEVRARYPRVYQWVVERVKPERNQNNRKSYRENWWIHGEPRGNFRPALKGLPRYIATVETSKHRFFQFLDASILPDNMLVNIAVDDAYFLGVLSSRAHVCWALATGGTLEDRPRYNKSRCFETFPFPDATPEQKNRIRDLAGQLDTHRKSRQAEHPKLTVTSMYNVLEKLRHGQPLTPKEKIIHEQGLVSVLRQIHDDLDKEVSAAYGWPTDLAEEEILEHLVTLNASRAAEESQGIVRWLRPEFQNPQGDGGQTTIDTQPGKPGDTKKKAGPKKKSPWPKELPEQVGAVLTVLSAANQPLAAETVARYFTRARTTKVAPLLDTLVAVGQARLTEDGRYVLGK